MDPQKNSGGKVKQSIFCMDEKEETFRATGGRGQVYRKNGQGKANAMVKRKNRGKGERGRGGKRTRGL